MRCMSTAKEIFLTDWAIAHVFARLAVVIVKEQSIDAHAAVVAMTKVFSATDATKTAIDAVVGRLALGHPQVADVAVILSKLNAAASAVVAVKRRDVGEFAPW